MSSRTWLECFIPRDLTMLSARFRSPAWLMFTNDTLDVHQVDFRAEGLSARRMHPQHAALQMRAKANAHRGKVAHDFGRIFVKADVKRAFLAQTRSFSKGARED